MPRQKEPEGRRNTVCAKLSDSELEAVETARGAMERSEWVRLTLLAAAERQRPPTGYGGGRPAHSPTCKCGMCRPPKNGGQG